ncbi:MAG: hypothetical protein IPK27_11380 [Rhodanobacteraceae bacterium]|nr:hypothetical protein [Rhodanobacteraceae bacterium]
MNVHAPVALAVVLVGLVGCAGPSALLVDAAGNPSGSLNISDERPGNELKFNSRCLAVPGREIGEAAFSPSRIVALQTRLEHAMPTRVSGNAILVHRFQACIEENGFNPAGLAGVSYAAAVVADGSAKRGVDLASVDLEIEIDGVRYRSRRALNCHVGYVTTYALESQSVQQAIWKSLDAAVEDIVAQVNAAG